MCSEGRCWSSQGKHSLCVSSMEQMMRILPSRNIAGEGEQSEGGTKARGMSVKADELPV